MVQYSNRWPELAAKIKPATQKGVKRVAVLCQGNIRANAPVETGFMRDSVYVSTPDSSDYGQGGSPPGKSYLLEEVKPPDDMTAIVGAAANYSVFVELGHRTRGGGSFVPAHPWFIPGVEQTRGQFETIMAAELAAGLV